MGALNASNKPKGDLGRQPWLTQAATRTVIEALGADGADVRFIGGCVRDSLLKRPVKDIDMATPDQPDKVIELLERAGIKAIPTGIAHGTITAVADKQWFEITTLRRDEETDGRHARVAFTDDWVADAGRRDFTINAMSANAVGEVFDYHNGIAHLSDGRVRFIGRAETRIDEDYLRILRFFRFFGGYGRAPINREAMDACRTRADKLSNLSGERVRDEMLKILSVPAPAEILLQIRDVGALDVILPEAGDVDRLRMVNWLETRAVNIEGVEVDPIRHLAALLHTDQAGTAALSVAERWRLSNAERSRLTDLAAPAIEITAAMDSADEMRALRRHGADRVRDLALLSWSQELTVSSRLPRSRTDSYIALLELCARWTAPTFPLTGADVLALGLVEGPEVGALLESVEGWWENGGYKADRRRCLDRLVRETEADR